MDILAQINVKKPSNDTFKSIMFITPENNLISSDPKQLELFVKEPKNKEVYVKSIKQELKKWKKTF
jgi:hypothetical protein